MKKYLINYGYTDTRKIVVDKGNNISFGDIFKLLKSAISNIVKRRIVENKEFFPFVEVKYITPLSPITINIITARRMLCGIYKYSPSKKVCEVEKII